MDYGIIKQELEDYVLNELKELELLSPEQLVAKRQEKILNLGAFKE